MVFNGRHSPLYQAGWSKYFKLHLDFLLKNVIIKTTAAICENDGRISRRKLIYFGEHSNTADVIFKNYHNENW